MKDKSYNYNYDDVEDFTEFEKYYGFNDDSEDDEEEPKELNFDI